jgi:hypothetical protein
VGICFKTKTIFVFVIRCCEFDWASLDGNAQKGRKVILRKGGKIRE